MKLRLTSAKRLEHVSCVLIKAHLSPKIFAFNKKGLKYIHYSLHINQNSEKILKYILVWQPRIQYHTQKVGNTSPQIYTNQNE